MLHRISRRIIHTGRYPGLAGAIGRAWGRRIGWRLPRGQRMIIDSPLEVIQSQILYKGVYEPAITDLLSSVARQGSVFIDVGGNIGYYSTLMAYSGCTVHTFEPLPRLAARLRENIALNHLEPRVSIANFALSSTEGAATLHVAIREDDGSHSLIEGVEAPAFDKIQVKTLRLDTYIESRRVPRVDIIKIDVEGAESLVLDGAVKVLKDCRPVVVLESGDRLADQLKESSASVLKRLTSQGYEVFLVQSPELRLQAVGPDRVPSEVKDYLAVPRERMGDIRGRLPHWSLT